MEFNTLAYATIFQNTLDKIAIQQALTGWMEPNAGLVIYNGGREVKIPKMTVDGLGDYDRDSGYPQGGINLEYETRTMTQDRGRKFQIDAMDVDETAFVATASNAMGEFQRVHVIPEIDAYRLSKLISAGISGGTAKYNYTPAESTILREIKAGIAAIREAGFDGPLICHINSTSKLELELALANKLTSVTFSKGGIDTTVPAVDGVPLIETPNNRMYSAITMLDGKTSGQTNGGYQKGSTALDCNFVIAPMTTAIAISKQDKMKIFTPDQNQDADAWKMNYRRYHDMWVLDNKMKSIYVNMKQAKQ